MITAVDAMRGRRPVCKDLNVRLWWMQPGMETCARPIIGE
jgi:hypothetical protein